MLIQKKYPQHFNREQGFTLIEILIVFTLIITLTSMGFVGIREFSERRIVTETRLNFTSLLKLARSRAQTQVKPATCTGGPLEGYRVLLSCSQSPCSSYTQFELAAVCGNTPDSISTGTFPTGVIVTSPTSLFYFRTLSGTVTGVTDQSDVVFQQGRETGQIISVFEDGRIVTYEE